MEILVISWQDLGTILAKILSRRSHGIHFAMVRSDQVRHEKFYLEDQDGKKKLLRTACRT